MPELSIELTPHEHERLRMRAHDRGESVESYVRDLIADDVEDELKPLHDWLRARLAQVEAGHVVSVGAEDIKRKGRARRQQANAS